MSCFLIFTKKYIIKGKNMFQYQGVFISSIVALLLINISCNVKDDKNSQGSGFDPNLKRNKREIIDENNSEISFHHKRIPSGTCSTYKISSRLDNEFINSHLKLIDEEELFTLDKNSQKLCAYKTHESSHRKPAPIHSKAQLVLEQRSGKISDEIEVTSKAPSVTEIIDEFPAKNPYSEDPILKKSNSFYVPAGGNSDNYKFTVYNNNTGRYGYLNSANEYSIVGKHIESSNLVSFPITIVPDPIHNSPSFYFNVPENSTLGQYNLRLRTRETDNVERLFTIYVVEKDKNLNSPKIKSIGLVYNNTTTTDISIPIGTCVDYKVIATDLNDNKYNITEENWYTAELNPERSFTLLHDQKKICAYNNQNHSTPRLDEETMFIIKYQNLTHGITLKAVASPQFILNSKKPISEKSLNVKAGFKTTNFKINLINISGEIQNIFANNAEDFEILDEDNKIIKLNSKHESDGSTSFNFILPYQYYDKSFYSFTLRMKHYPNIKETFSVNVTQ